MLVAVTVWPAVTQINLLDDVMTKQTISTEKAGQDDGYCMSNAMRMKASWRCYFFDFHSVTIAWCWCWVATWFLFLHHKDGLCSEICCCCRRKSMTVSSSNLSRTGSDGYPLIPTFRHLSISCNSRSCKGDDGSICNIRIVGLSNQLCSFVAVHLGHETIHENNIPFSFFHSFNSIDPIRQSF